MAEDEGRVLTIEITMSICWLNFPSLSTNTSNESDQRRLDRYVEELEKSAVRLEQSAVAAKAG